MQKPHGQVYGAPMCPAGEAAVDVAAHGEGERGVVVVVEGAERLVPRHLESESLRDPSIGR